MRIQCKLINERVHVIYNFGSTIFLERADSKTYNFETCKIQLFDRCLIKSLIFALRYVSHACESVTRSDLLVKIRHFMLIAGTSQCTKVVWTLHAESWLLIYPFLCPSINRSCWYQAQVNARKLSELLA